MIEPSDTVDRENHGRFPKRLTCLLTEAQWALLLKIRSASGQSIGTIIRALIDDAAPRWADR